VPSNNLRTMSWATLTNTIGSGLWTAAQALYFTRIVGMPAVQVGAAITIANLVGLASSVPLGRIADRRDPRMIRAGIQALQALVAVTYVTVGSFWPLLLVTTLDSGLQTANIVVRAALVAAVGGAKGRVRAYAVLRVVAAIGMAVGAGAAAIAVAFDTAMAYHVLIAVNAATYLLSSVLLLRLPAFQPEPKPTGNAGHSAMRDARFLGVSVGSAVVALHRGVLPILVPLWIVQHTAAPKVAISIVLVVNTAVSIVVTVPASRRLTSAAAGARGMRWAGLLLGVSMVLYSLATFGSAGAAVGVLIGATTIYAIGELLYATSNVTLSYELAAPGAIGDYQGTNNLITGVAFAVSPLLMTAVVLRAPDAGGWIGLAVAFAVAGAVVPTMTRRAAGRVVPATGES
jgi:hypothetical protein